MAKNQIKLFIETAGPPRLNKALVAVCAWVTISIGLAVGVQIYISMETNPEKQAVIINNTRLWIGQFGMIGLIVLVAILILFVFAIIVFVYYAKFMVSDVSTFLATMQALANTLVKRFTRFPSIGQFIKAII